MHLIIAMVTGHTLVRTNKAGKKHYHPSSNTLFSSTVLASYPYAKVFLIFGLLKLKIENTSKESLTLQSLTYHSHCVCPEPNADRLNLGLQTGDSTI